IRLAARLYHPGQGAQALEDRQRQILAHAFQQQQALCLALLRHVGEARAYGAAGGRAIERSAVDVNGPGRQAVSAEEGFEKVSLSLSDQSTEAEDFAAPQFETDA